MKKLLAVLLATLVLNACNSSSKTVTPEEAKATLIKTPGFEKIEQVNKTTIPGLYEVVVDRNIFYVTNDAKYAMFGNLVDLKTQKSLTEERMQELAKIDFSKLPKELAIKEVIGDGSREIAVFSDPDCPYCKLFEKDVAPNLKNVTIYTFLFPLPMHPEAENRSKNIWCSKDKLAAWQNYMKEDKEAAERSKDCDVSVIEKTKKIADELVKISGTPTIVLGNGQILSGYLPAEKFNEKLDEISAKKPVASAAK